MSVDVGRAGAVRTATGEIVREGEIVVARIFPGVRQSVDDALENLETAISLRAGRARPILVDIRGCEPLDPEVRACYSGDRVTHSFTAVAMLIETTTFGRMIGNIYLQIAALRVPSRLFTERDAAVAWLKRYV